MKELGLSYSVGDGLKNNRNLLCHTTNDLCTKILCNMLAATLSLSFYLSFSPPPLSLTHTHTHTLSHLVPDVLIWRDDFLHKMAGDLMK